MVLRPDTTGRAQSFISMFPTMVSPEQANIWKGVMQGEDSKYPGHHTNSTTINHRYKSYLVNNILCGTKMVSRAGEKQLENNFSETKGYKN